MAKDPETVQPVRVALLDDHRIILDGVSALLQPRAEVRVIHQTTSAQQLMALLRQDPVDVVLLDLFLPEPIGLDVLADLVSKHPECRVIVLSGNSEEELLVGAFRTGAKGYLTKNVEQEELVNAILAVHQGEQYLSRKLTGELSSSFIRRAIGGDRFGSHKVRNLSGRELEIIRMLSEGLSQKEVARDLGISVRTVEAHRSNILEKLELRTTIDLVKYAIKNRIVEI